MILELPEGKTTTAASADALIEAIATAVAELHHQRGRVVTLARQHALDDRLGALAHELREYLDVTLLTVAAIRSGSVPLNGAAATLLEDSLANLRDALDTVLANDHLADAVPANLSLVPVDRLVEEVAATVVPRIPGRRLEVAVVEPGLHVVADRPRLASATVHMVLSAFRATPFQGKVSLKAYPVEDRVRIEVADSGWQEGASQRAQSERTACLAIARRAAVDSGGKLLVHELPGAGNVCALDLRRR